MLIPIHQQYQPPEVQHGHNNFPLNHGFQSPDHLQGHPASCTPVTGNIMDIFLETEETK